jgi:hypothetical protein
MLGPDQRTLLTTPIAHPDGSKHAGYRTPTSCSTTAPVASIDEVRVSAGALGGLVDPPDTSGRSKDSAAATALTRRDTSSNYWKLVLVTEARPRG